MATTKPKQKQRTGFQSTQEKPNQGKKGARGQSEGIASKRGSPTMANPNKNKPGRKKQTAKTPALRKADLKSQQLRKK